MAARFNELLAAGEMTRVFALGRMPHPIMVDMFALAGGYHGFWIDREHVAVSSDQMTGLAQAARANGMDTFVRIPPTGYSLVTQSLETGAGGVMAAQIHSAEQAREFVAWTKFAPEGTRGLNAGGRDANYSHKPPAQFIKDANRDHFVAIQIETLGSVDQAEAIAGIDGVNLLFVGPADLSLALGVVGEFHHEKLWDAIAKVDAACAKHGKYWGCVAPDPAFADRAASMRCRMLTVGNEILAVRRGIEKLKEAFTSQF